VRPEDAGDEVLGNGTAVGFSSVVLGNGLAATGAGLRTGADGLGAGAVTGAATGAAVLAFSPGV
jgi:hypothetical protein